MLERSTNEWRRTEGPRGSEGPTRAAPHSAQPPGTETAFEANCALSSVGAFQSCPRRLVAGLAAVCSNAQLASVA